MAARRSTAVAQRVSRRAAPEPPSPPPWSGTDRPGACEDSASQSSRFPQILKAASVHRPDAQPGCTVGTVISKESHTFTGDPVVDLAPPPVAWETGLEGKETNTQFLEADGT